MESVAQRKLKNQTRNPKSKQIENDQKSQRIKRRQTPCLRLFRRYGFYSSLDLFRILRQLRTGFELRIRILLWHFWQPNRKFAALIEGACCRDVAAVGSGDGAS